MIEFIIPLNLPVRAVEVTEADGAPSIRLQREFLCLVEQRRSRGGAGSSLPGTETATGDPDLHSPSELQRELIALRSQKAMFVSGVESLRQACCDVQRQLDGMMSDLKEAAIDLSVSIASKLIFEEIEHDRFPVANLVHEVLGRLNTTSGATIRMHPDDLAQIQDYPEIEGADRETALRFVPDSNLARGDCTAKAGEIGVVYDLRRQIDEIRQELLSTVSGHAES